MQRLIFRPTSKQLFTPASIGCPHRTIIAVSDSKVDFVRSARDLQHSKKLVLLLYKKILRSMPILLTQFELDGVGMSQIARSNIRDQFNSHIDITSIPVVDTLRHKAELEWEESMLMHKTKSHFAYSVFGDPLLSASLNLPHGLPAQQGKKQTNYLNSFYQGTAQ